MSRALALAAAALAACGPKPAPVEVPMLPGDGDQHVAKPVSDNKPDDPWAGKTLIEPPVAKPPTAIELPEIESYKLSNGLAVYLVKSDRLPTASIQVAVRAGRMHEPRARLGVAEFTADMLVKGTRRRSALELAKAIDFVGGTISADATFEATLMSCSVLARHLPTCFDLVPDMVTQPTFPEAELVKVRDQQLAGVRQRLDDAATLSSAHVQNLLWGSDHVRGWVTSPESVASLKRDDLQAWHKAWFVPANAMVVVAGDIDFKRVKADLERTFGQWAKGPVPPTPQYKQPELSGSRIRLVDKPGQTQTQIRIAQFGIAHTDPRFFAMLAWNYALGGGGFSSRLTQVVRVQGGKTYGANSTFDRNADRGSFVAATFTRNQEAVATTKLVLDEIAKMAKSGPTAGELTAAIANLAGSYGLRFQSAADIGTALLTAELHGFGREYVKNFPVAVGKVDLEYAKQTAAEILDPNAYVVVMVGDAKDLEPQLKAAGWKYQKVGFAEPVTAQVKEAAKPIDPKALAAAQQIVSDALTAKGGKAKLAGITGFKMTASGATTIGGRSVPVEIERLYVLPDKMRLDATLMGRVKILVVANGPKGWQVAPDQSTGKPMVADMTAADLSQIDFERWREPELILLKASEPATKAWAVADENINGKPHGVVKLTAPQGVEISLYIDKQSKLLTRMVFVDGGASNTDNFSDFKEVAGIKIAHTRHSSGLDPASGQPRDTKLELKNVEINPKFDAKSFDKPTL